ncbi:hypothetical protein J6590_040928, partial [Homalodisca vitripennis]
MNNVNHVSKKTACNNARYMNTRAYTHPRSFEYITCLCSLDTTSVNTKGDAWWKNMTTADESWIYCYDHATKQQSTEWGQTINAEYHILVLKKLIKDHIPKSGQTSSDAGTCITTMIAPMLPILPDLVQYPETKKKPNGRPFPTATSTIKTSEAILKVLFKPGFEHVFKELQRWLNKCMVLNCDHLK